MSLVRPNREIHPQPSTHTPAKAQHYDTDMVVVSQKLSTS